MPRGASVSRPSGRGYTALRGRAAFRRAFRTGSRRRKGGVVVIVASGEPGPPRVGVVAGKKKVGGAAQRNRAKRRLREAVAVIPLREGNDYVVVASSTVLTAPFDEVVGWLRAAVGEETSDG